MPLKFPHDPPPEARILRPAVNRMMPEPETDKQMSDRFQKHLERMNLVDAGDHFASRRAPEDK